MDALPGSVGGGTTRGVGAVLPLAVAKAFRSLWGVRSALEIGSFSTLVLILPDEPLAPSCSPYTV